MDNYTKDYINELAEQVIRAYKISIPIENLESVVVHSMGGRIEEKSSFDDLCEGTIRKEGTDSFHIVIPSQQYPQRKVFTIAHELGHLFLHMGFRTNPGLWNMQKDTVYKRFGTSEQEYQANEFAASLLMPRDIYKSVLYKNAVGDNVNIIAVAEYFNVSIAAATNRGKFLGYLI